MGARASLAQLLLSLGIDRLEVVKEKRGIYNQNKLLNGTKCDRKQEIETTITEIETCLMSEILP